jgi:hypothetical protein
MEEQQATSRRPLQAATAAASSLLGCAERVTQHAVAAIARADYFERPYPHIVFPRFFPDDFYRTLLATLPDMGSFCQLNGADTRRQFSLFEAEANPGAPPLPEAWAIVSALLNSREIELALRDRLAQALEMRAQGSGEATPLPMHPQPVIYADFDGYFIKPHPDTRRKVMTMQVYMPEDDRQADLGTTIYKVSAKGLFSPRHFGLAEDKTLPYVPNLGYAFVVIHPRHNFFRASWHGRKDISVSADKPRISLLNAYYAKPPTRS